MRVCVCVPRNGFGFRQLFIIILRIEPEQEQSAGKHSHIDPTLAFEINMKIKSTNAKKEKDNQKMFVQRGSSKVRWQKLTKVQPSRAEREKPQK